LDWVTTYREKPFLDYCILTCSRFSNRTILLLFGERCRRWKQPAFGTYPGTKDTEHKDSKASLAKQLTEYSTKILRARELLLTGDIDGTDYKQIKQDCEHNISIIEAKLADAGKKKLYPRTVGSYNR